MLCTEILAIALGLMASTAYSAPTGIINGRGPQQIDEGVIDATNKLQSARALKSRGLQLDARAPQNPFSDAIDKLVNGRSVQALDARAPQDPLTDAANELLNPSSRKARSPQVVGRIEEDDRNNNLPQASPPSLKSRNAQNADQDAASKFINRILPASGRRSAQGENRGQNGIRPNVSQAQNQSGRKVRSA